MYLEVLHFLCYEQETCLRHLQRNRLSQGRKTCFACRKAERGQAQPQLYGTSYFFVKMALTGPNGSDEGRIGHDDRDARCSPLPCFTTTLHTHPPSPVFPA